MRKTKQIIFKQVFLTLLLAFAMILSYLAGTISVEAQISQSATRATTNQIAAVSAAVTLLLSGTGQTETIYLPLIMGHDSSRN